MSKNKFNMKSLTKLKQISSSHSGAIQYVETYLWYNRSFANFQKNTNFFVSKIYINEV